MRWRHLAATTAAILTAAALALPARAANPIVTGIYTADPATLVHNGRMYVYTGRDEAAPGQNEFVMRDWRVYSRAAPSDDPAAWTDHGPRLSLSTFAWAGANAWASEVVAGPDGRFYWFVSVDGSGPGWMNIGVAVANSTPAGLTGFWEVPWLFKRGSTYYPAYASNSGDCVTSSSYACVRYTTATNVLGPWTERGVVGRVSSTTSHPAIEEFGGQWWLVYHNADAPGGGNFRRSIAIDRLYFEADGSIRKVIPTRGPGNPNPDPTALNAYNTTTFTPVTTTRLRALLTPRAFSGSGGVGVLEWRVRPVTPTTAPLSPAR